MLTFYRDQKWNDAFLFSFVLKPYVSQDKFPFSCIPEPIDKATPTEAHSRTGFDGNEYKLVFKVDGRTGELLSHFICFVIFLFIFVLVHYYPICPQPPCSPMTTSVVFSRSHSRINCTILGGGILRPLFSRVSFPTSSLGHGYISVNWCCC